MLRFFRRAAALMLLLGLALGARPALAGTIACQSCGKAIRGDECAYCPYCGVQVTNALSIRDAYQMTDGNVFVAWNDGAGHPPYKVLYAYYCDPVYGSDPQQRQLYWSNGDAAAGTSCVLNDLAPGFDYWIVIEDGQGNTCRYHYSAPEVYPFRDFSTSLTLIPRRKSGSDFIKLSAFSASALESGQDDVGLYLKLDFSSLRRDYTFDFKTVVVDPLGVPIVVNAYADGKLSSGWTNHYWNFQDLTWYFSKVKKQYGEVPTGAYKVYVLYDGQLAGTANFTVK